MFTQHSKGDKIVAKELAEDIFNYEMSKIVFTSKNEKPISIAYIFDLPTYNFLSNDPTTAEFVEKKIYNDIFKELGINVAVLPIDVDPVRHVATLIANKQPVETPERFTKREVKPKKK